MNTVSEIRSAPAPKTQKTVRSFLRHSIGLDRTIGFTVLARFWSAAAGVITILLIARFLTQEQQGYYFTFSSLIALQIVFELGFSFVILQLAAHERAELSFLPDGQIEGPQRAQSRLASILQTSVRWYSIAAVLMAVALMPAGFWFFSAHHKGAAGIHWKTPWLLLVLATSITFQMDPVFSFLEGCGSVLQVARMRFGQAVLGSLFAWITMLLHRGLFAPAAMLAGQAIVGLVFLSSPARRMLLRRLLRFKVGAERVGWRAEIWPFQWRIAISWLCGYFIFQLFNPVLFAYQGAVAAGRMGMSLSIATSIGAVAIAWMNTKASPFGAMVARGDITALDDLFFRTLRQSTLLLAGGAAAFFGVLLAVVHYLPAYAERVLPPWAFALLLLTTIMNHVVFCEALYLRTHKREPFLGVTVIGAVLVTAATVLLARFVGTNSVMVGYFVITALFGLPSGTYIFVTRRRAWHPQAS